METGLLEQDPYKFTMMKQLKMWRISYPFGFRVISSYLMECSQSPCCNILVLFHGGGHYLEVSVLPDHVSCHLWGNFTLWGRRIWSRMRSFLGYPCHKFVAVKYVVGWDLKSIWFLFSYLWCLRYNSKAYFGYALWILASVSMCHPVEYILNVQCFKIRMHKIKLISHIKEGT